MEQEVQQKFNIHATDKKNIENIGGFGKFETICFLNLILGHLAIKWFKIIEVAIKKEERNGEEGNKKDINK